MLPSCEDGIILCSFALQYQRVTDGWTELPLIRQCSAQLHTAKMYETTISLVSKMLAETLQQKMSIHTWYHDLYTVGHS